MPTRFDAALQPLPPPAHAAVDVAAQWKEFEPQTAKMMRMLWATDPDGALRRLLTLPPGLSQPAMASLGGFVASKVPADEPLLQTVVREQQLGWAALAGRSFWARTSAPTRACGCSRSRSPPAPSPHAAIESKIGVLLRTCT